MAHYEESRTYPNRSSAECFAAADKALPQAGFPIFKRRPIAWLVLGQRKEGAEIISGNISCLMAGRVTLAMGGDQTPQETLKQYAGQIFEKFEAELLSSKGKA
jgi:hypothetical protein